MISRPYHLYFEEICNKNREESFDQCAHVCECYGFIYVNPLCKHNGEDSDDDGYYEIYGQPPSQMDWSYAQGTSPVRLTLFFPQDPNLWYKCRNTDKS